MNDSVVSSGTLNGGRRPKLAIKQSNTIQNMRFRKHNKNMHLNIAKKERSKLCPQPLHLTNPAMQKRSVLPPPIWLQYTKPLHSLALQFRKVQTFGLWYNPHCFALLIAICTDHQSTIQLPYLITLHSFLLSRIFT